MAWPAQLEKATGLARRAADTTEWPGLGRRTPGPLRLIVVPDARRLDSLSSGRSPGWGAAVALPGDRTVLLRADAGVIYRTLRQELAHLVLHKAVQGRVPLWFAEGSGASARQILGTVVIVGMLADTLIASFLIPVSFYVVEKLSRGLKGRLAGTEAPAPEPAAGD